MLCPYWDSEIKKWKFHCSNLNFITDFLQSLQIYPNLVICLDNPLIASNFLLWNACETWWNSEIWWFTLKCMCDMIITYSTSCLSTPAESTPESSPVKTRPTKSVPSEKDLNFLPLQCVLVIWVTPREILNCWSFPMNFWSFGISLLILL